MEIWNPYLKLMGVIQSSCEAASFKFTFVASPQKNFLPFLQTRLESVVTEVSIKNKLSFKKLKQMLWLGQCFSKYM